MMMKKKIILSLFTCILLLVSSIAGLKWFYTISGLPQKILNTNNFLCVQVQGFSMIGMVDPWEYLWIEKEIKDIRKGDIVLFEGTFKQLYVKKIFGKQWDTLSLVDTKSGFQVQINGSVVKTSTGVIFEFSKNKKDLLTLYQGILPRDTYFVLGNHAEGTYDASRFGLINVSQIKGIVREKSTRDDFCQYKKTGSYKEW